MGKALSFLKEARAELGKVIWPNRRRAIRLTAAVVVVTVVFAAFIGAADFGFSRGVESVLTASKQKPKTGQTVPVQPGSGTQSVQIPAGGSNQPNQPSNK